MYQKHVSIFLIFLICVKNEVTNDTAVKWLQKVDSKHSPKTVLEEWFRHFHFNDNQIK